MGSGTTFRLWLPAACGDSLPPPATGQPFEVVLLDLTVPGGLGGVDTLAALRAIDPTVRAVASSGYSSNRVLADPQSFGFDAVLPKPYLLSDLRAVVQAAVAAGARAP